MGRRGPARTTGHHHRNRLGLFRFCQWLVTFCSVDQLYQCPFSRRKCHSSRPPQFRPLCCRGHQGCQGRTGVGITIVQETPNNRTELKAPILLNHGAVFVSTGDLIGAKARHEQGLALALVAPGENQSVLAALVNLGLLHSQMG